MEVTTLLQAGAILLVNLEVLDDFLGTSGCLAAKLLLFTAAATSCQQANSAQSNSAGQQGATIEL